MTERAAKILKQALALPSADRADIASVLMNSLDPKEDPAIEAAWKEEIAGRIEETDSGKLQLIPWEVVRKRIRDACK